MKAASVHWGALFLLLVAGLSWGLHVTITRTGPYGADFWTMWLGARAFWVDGISPYDETVTLKSQMGIYGRPARPDEDQVRFAYPLPVVWLLAPLAFLPYDWAQSVWMAWNLSTVLLLAIWLFPRLPFRVWLTIPLFYPLTRDWLLGQFSLFLLWWFWLCWWLWTLQRSWSDAVLGFALAVALCKPQSAMLWVVMWLWMALVNRRYVWYGFLAGVLLWWGVPALWYPSWPVAWFRQLFVYWGSNPYPGLLSRVNAVAKAGAPGMVVLGGVLLGVWWLLGHWWRQGCLDDWVLMAGTAWLSTLLSPQSIPTDQVLYLLPLLVWLDQEPRRRRQTFWWVMVAAGWLCFFAFFRGKEPLAVWGALLALFGVWALWLIWKAVNALPEVAG